MIDIFKNKFLEHDKFMDNFIQIPNLMSNSFMKENDNENLFKMIKNKSFYENFIDEEKNEQQEEQKDKQKINQNQKKMVTKKASSNKIMKQNKNKNNTLRTQIQKLEKQNFDIIQNDEDDQVKWVYGKKENNHKNKNRITKEKYLQVHNKEQNPKEKLSCHIKEESGKNYSKKQVTQYYSNVIKY
eukprot:TRINITY_DN607_c2_g1_i1.p1 TRINITY_DN607_c2_g1~~TRINITY_DN607_c2_g1_i1.p1  ORF type:complete len:185 (-),score=47.67 TRINITY_DN607_c2_g1_i1:93-647(-)